MTQAIAERPQKTKPAPAKAPAVKTGVMHDMELSDQSAEILMAAVRLARNESILRVSKLRARLLDEFPKATDKDVTAALTYWATYSHRTKSAT